MSNDDRKARTVLQKIARRVMIERGLAPDFPPAAIAELSAIRGPAAKPDSSTRDMRELLWCSIDNDDSRDLDQLSVAEALPGGAAKLMVAVADVGALVAQGSALDGHASGNTTSVYTSGGIFPMLPERLSTDLTSLNPDQDRDAFIIEYLIGEGGLSTHEVLYFARVRNHAKLAYRGVGEWLEGKGPLPEAAAKVPGIEGQLKLQDGVA